MDSTAHFHYGGTEPAPSSPSQEADMDTSQLTPPDFHAPAVLLSGPVDYDMYRSFRDQLGRADERSLIVVELSTLGGDPEVARMMGEDIRFASEMTPQRRFVFLGKAMIYSACQTALNIDPGSAPKVDPSHVCP